VYYSWPKIFAAISPATTISGKGKKEKEKGKGGEKNCAASLHSCDPPQKKRKEGEKKGTSRKGTERTKGWSRSSQCNRKKKKKKKKKKGGGIKGEGKKTRLLFKLLASRVH